MMTLEEAIKHAEEVAEGHEKIKCIKAVTLEECKCAEEHRQLAEWLKDYKRLLDQQPSDTVSRGAFEQVMYERDIAIEQLHELGYEWGQKIEPCEDSISRQAVINAIENDCMKGGLGSCFASYDDAQKFRGEIEKLPSVTVRQTDCENCSKCEGAFMRGHDVGLENGYKQGERDARYESVTQKTDNKYRKEAKRWKNKWLKQQKSGKWRPVYQGDEIINYRCSECEFGNTFGKSTYRMNYCPNCGADMRG